MTSFSPASGSAEQPRTARFSYKYSFGPHVLRVPGAGGRLKTDYERANVSTVYEEVLWAVVAEIGQFVSVSSSIVCRGAQYRLSSAG